jgi:hypothetical protein
MPALDPDRDVGVQFLLDTNRINSRQNDADMNQLERWGDDGVITLVMSESSQDEAMAGGDDLRFRKAVGHIATITHGDTGGEERLARQIEAVLFPSGAVTQNEKNDVDIVLNAAKYGGSLITNDGGSKRQPGGILGNAEALGKLGIRVMRAAEAVTLVQEKILVRDRNEHLRAGLCGAVLPEWVGLD